MRAWDRIMLAAIGAGAMGVALGGWQGGVGSAGFVLLLGVFIEAIW